MDSRKIGVTVMANSPGTTGYGVVVLQVELPGWIRDFHCITDRGDHDGVLKHAKAVEQAVQVGSTSVELLAQALVAVHSYAEEADVALQENFSALKSLLGGDVFRPLAVGADLVQKMGTRAMKALREAGLADQLDVRNSDQKAPSVPEEKAVLYDVLWRTQMVATSAAGAARKAAELQQDPGLETLSFEVSRGDGPSVALISVKKKTT